MSEKIPLLWYDIASNNNPSGTIKWINIGLYIDWPPQCYCGQIRTVDIHHSGIKCHLVSCREVRIIPSSSMKTTQWNEVKMVLTSAYSSLSMLDCHCPGRPFQRIPLFISSTGLTAQWQSNIDPFHMDHFKVGRTRVRPTLYLSHAHANRAETGLDNWVRSTSEVGFDPVVSELDPFHMATVEPCFTPSRCGMSIFKLGRTRFVQPQLRRCLPHNQTSAKHKLTTTSAIIFFFRITSFSNERIMCMWTRTESKPGRNRFR